MANQISVNSGSQDISLEVTSARQITVNAETQTVDVVIESRGNIELTLSRAISVTGVQQIVAGNNITISPANGIGVVTINSAGSANVEHANTANYANYSNYAGNAYSVSGSNVSGQVANALIAGDVYNNAQSNITSLGTLTGLNVSGPIVLNTSTVEGNIVPSSNVTYNLGNNTNRFKDLYLSGSTIYIDAQTITADVNGITFSGNIVGDGSQISNITGANVTGAVAYASTANSVAGANVSGEVANANYASYSNSANYSSVAYSVDVGNVVGLGNIATLNLDGNSGNILFGNGVFASAPNVSSSNTANYANYANFAGEAFSVSASNISGVVNLANFATTANAVAGGNVSGEVNYAAVANAVAGANVSGEVTLATYATTANAVSGANVSGAVGLATFATTANAVAGANVSGEVAHANVANNVAGANVSGAVAYATTANSVAGANVTGQVDFAAVANSVAGSNVVGDVLFANYANFSGTSFSVSGSNVTGTVANATHATIADAANSVAGANVVGFVANASHATIADAANVAYLVDGANVNGQVSNALISGTVYTNAQPNITSTGTLTSLSVGGNISATGNISGAYFLGDGSYLTGIGNLAGAEGYWGSFYSNVNQTANSSTVATAITLNNSDPDNNGVYVSSNSHVNFTYAGVYNFQFSIQILNTQTNPVEASFWLRKNGTDVVDSRGTLAVSDKQGTQPGQSIVSWNYIIKLNSNDYLELYWQTEDSTHVQLEFLPAGTTPTTPASPSVIVTAQQVTNVQAAALSGSLTGNLLGNGYGLSSMAFVESVGNISGNVFTGNANGLYNIVGANVTGFVANATHANLADFASTANAVAGANVSGFVANASHASIADAANVAYSVSGANVSGTVANATYAVTAGEAYAVSAANIVGTINLANFATTANSVAGANVSGEVAHAAVANSVNVANVVGIGNIATINLNGNSTEVLYGNGVFAGVADGNFANYSNFANFAGNITVASQPNITSLGTLTNVEVSGNVTASRLVSNIATGTAPLTVTSTTQVANLRANSAQYVSVVSNTASSVFYPVFVSASGSNTTATLSINSGDLEWDNTGGNGTLISPEFEGKLVGASGSTTYINPGTTSIDTRISGTSRLLVNSSGANVTGNVNASTSINAPRFVSIVAIGTAPFTVTSTTRVANLNVANAGVADSATVAASANSVAVANVVGIGNIATVNFDGNASNALLGNGVFGAISVSSVANANYANFAGTAYSVDAANISGTVNLANFATTANAVAGANVSGTVANATYATNAGTAYAVDAANIVGVVNLANFATTANAVAGANVSGQVANALVAGTVYTNAQPNITSTGTLTSLNVSGNINGNSLLFVGFGANTSGFTNPVIVGKAGGSQYVQAALVNSSDTGSADWVAYGDNGTDNNAWSDMGFTGSNFNDANYTITGKNDGYLFVQGDGANVNGGSLVFATGDQGITKDIVFATGGFLAANEKMRFIHSTGQFHIETTTAATTTSTGALRVRGGIGVAGNVVSGGNISASYYIGNGSALTGITATVAPAGSNTQIQYNDAGTAGASANLTFNNTTNTLSVTNIIANGAGLSSLTGANVTGAVAYATTANSVAGSNVSGAVGLATFATTANAVAGANVSGQVANAVLAEHVYNNSQPNITSTGTLVNLAVTSSSLTANTPVNFNQSWNNASANFTVLRLNTTNTASDVNSKMLDIQVNTVSQFSVYANNYTDLGNVAYANYHTGNANISALNVSGVSNLNSVSNVIITGGTNGYVLSTNGSGNLSWVAQSGGGGGSSETDFTPSFLLGGM